MAPAISIHRRGSLFLLAISSIVETVLACISVTRDRPYAVLSKYYALALAIFTLIISTPAFFEDLKDFPSSASVVAEVTVSLILTDLWFASAVLSFHSAHEPLAIVGAVLSAVAGTYGFILLAKAIRARRHGESPWKRPVAEVDELHVHLG